MFGLGLGLGLSPRNIKSSGIPLVPWVPTDISHISGWYDGSDATTIHEDTAAGRVSQWDDKSGNSNHLSCGTAANQPKTGVSVIDGKNTIQFGGGAAHYLSPDGTLASNPDFSNALDMSIHMVFKQDATVSQGAPVSMRSQIGGDSLIPDFNTLNRGYYPAEVGAYQIEDPTSMPRGSVYLLGFNASGTDVEIYKNGSLIFNLGSGQDFDSFNRFLLGYRAASSKLWIGEIAEIVVAGALSTADRQDLEGYLVNKWNV